MLDLTIRLIASLAVVVGLLLLLARLAGRRFSGTAGTPLQVLHRQPLSRSSSVAVVSVGSRILVLGTTEQQVRLLAEMMPDELDVAPLPSAVHDLGEYAEEDVEPDLEPGVAGELPSRRPAAAAAATAATGADQGALGGSLLSARTWQQAFAAVTGKAS